MRKVLFALLLGLSATVPADWSRWSLGGPSLLIDLPDRPAARMVAWDEPGAFGMLVTNWRSDTPNVRVDVVVRYDSIAAAKAWVAGRLKGTVQGERAAKVSGYDATFFQIGAASCVVVAQANRSWVVVAEPKNVAGQADALKVLNSVEVEKGGPMKWTRRSMGPGRISALLPYELSPDANPTNAQNPKFQADFQSFRVTSDLAIPDANSKLNLAGTLSIIIDGRKKGPGVTDFKVARKRVRVDQATGESAEMTFKQGSKPMRVTALLVDENDTNYRVEVGGPAERSDWHDRILGSIQISNLNFAGFQDQVLEEEGLKWESPGQMKPERANVGRGYGSFNGTIGLTVRSVDNLGIGINLEQLGPMVDIRLKAQEGAKNYKSEILKTQVDGVDARLIRSTFQLGSQEMDQRALVIAGADRTITFEILGRKADAPLLDRIQDSVQYEPPPPTAWSRMALGRSGLIGYLPKPFAKAPSAKEPWTKETELGIIESPGVVICFFEAEAVPGGAVPDPGVMMRTFVDGIVGGLEGTSRLLEQKPAGNDLDGIHHRLLITAKGAERPGDAFAFRKGDFLTVLLILHDPATLAGRQARQALVNSLQRG